MEVLERIDRGNNKLAMRRKELNEFKHPIAVIALIKVIDNDRLDIEELDYLGEDIEVIIFGVVADFEGSQIEI